MKISSIFAIIIAIALVAFLVFQVGKNPVEEVAEAPKPSTPVAVTPTPTQPSTPTPTPPKTPPSDPTACLLSVTKEVTLYTRPSESAGVFGTLSVNDTAVIVAKTKEGWLGFDPASAQAPNVGPFRLRYIRPSLADYSLTTANCTNLEVVETLPPNSCFMMAQGDINIYPSASTKVTPKYTMHAGDYILVTGRSSTNPTDYFIKVDSSKYGPIKGTVIGWIQSDDVNFNGEACTNLPVVK